MTVTQTLHIVDLAWKSYRKEEIAFSEAWEITMLYFNLMNLYHRKRKLVA